MLLTVVQQLDALPPEVLLLICRQLDHIDIEQVRHMRAQPHSLANMTEDDAPHTQKRMIRTRRVAKVSTTLVGACTQLRDQTGGSIHLHPFHP